MCIASGVSGVTGHSGPRCPPAPKGPHKSAQGKLHGAAVERRPGYSPPKESLALIGPDKTTEASRSSSIYGALTGRVDVRRPVTQGGASRLSPRRSALGWLILPLRGGRQTNPSSDRPRRAWFPALAKTGWVVSPGKLNDKMGKYRLSWAINCELRH